MFRQTSRLYKGVRAHPNIPWWQDALAGAVLGDFASQLGFWGAATQVLLSFIPIVGDVAAARDMAAGVHWGEQLDVLLNLLVMVPFIGGLAKVAAVVLRGQRIGRRLHILPGTSNKGQAQEREQGAA